MSTAAKAVVRCTRRIRDPLNYLIMQPTDADQITTSIRTTDAAIITWYVPLHSLQHCLHRRYEAEQFGEAILPRGTTAPTAKSLTPTEEEMGKAAAGKAGPSVWKTFKPMTAPSPSSSSSSSAMDGENVANQLNNSINAAGETVVPLGLVTMIVGRNIPAKQSRLERWVDPAPHPTLSLRITVMDRIQWQRTSWLVGSICNSLCWGRIPQRIFSVNIDYKSKLFISGGSSDGLGSAALAPLTFDHATQRYASPFDIRVPDLGFHLSLEDTGKTLFDPSTRIPDGFLDSESALNRLALAREVNMIGLGGSVYRQALWSSPSMPNVARVVDCQYGDLFNRYFGCSPIGDPVAVWLVDQVDKTLIYQMEGEVEDENDPNSATTYGDRSLTERVQKKAMNRYNSFRDDVRRKTYSDMSGEELPR